MPKLDPARRHALGALAGFGLAAVATARAQTGTLPPALKVVIPLPPGGSADAAVRLLAELLHKRHGTTVRVENRPGASGLLGLKAVSTAAADGSTLAYIISSHIATDLLSPQLDLLKEFDAVTMDSSSAYLVLVKADSPFQSLAGVVAAAKQAPGKLTYGSGGPGSALHIGMATLADAAGMQMLHVPYKGGIAAAQALAAGEVDVALALPGSAQALLAGGRVRALAVMAPDRLAPMPEVPTVREAIGVPAVYSSWGGFVVPKGTPPPTIAALHAALTQAMGEPAYMRLLAAAAGVGAPSESPAAFAELIRRQYAVEGELIERLGIKRE